MRQANKARGEVALHLGGQDLILCATMANLDALEQATKGLGITEIFAALSVSKSTVVIGALKALTIEGDADKALAEMVGVSEFPEIILSVREALVPDDPGNVLPGAESR